MILPDLHHPGLQGIISQISAVATCIYQSGWAEANAGNISVCVSHILHQTHDLSQDYHWYLVSRTGSRYRQMATDPIPNLVLIAKGQNDILIPETARPTSEWQSHYILQNAFPTYGCILHTHPAEVIAFCKKHRDLSTDEINMMLQELLPELSLYLPEGIALAAYHAPGSMELAQASLDAIKNQRALIWKGHGLICLGHDPDEALDYSEIIAKACKIALML